MAPAGAFAGPLSNDALPQIFAGGELGHAPLEAGNVVVEVVGLPVAVVGGALVAVGGLLVGAGAVVVGAVVVAGAVLVGAGAVVVGADVAVVVGEAVGVGAVTLLATLKSPRRLDLLPSDHVSTTVIRCDPSFSFVVSYGSALPSLAVPAKSNGGLVSVRKGGVVWDELSR